MRIKAAGKQRLSRNKVSISVVLGSTFVVGAIPKLRQPKIFTLQVLEYQIVGLRASKLIARLLPPIELLVGLLLLTGVLARVAAVGAALLLLTFVGAVGANVVRVRRVECGCFGAGWSRRTGWSLLVEDTVLLGGSVGLLWMTGNWAGRASWSPFALYSPVLTLLGIVVVCSVLCVMTVPLSGRRYLRLLLARRERSQRRASAADPQGQHAVERR